MSLIQVPDKKPTYSNVSEGRMGRKGVLLYWLIQKLTKQYERLQVERDKKRRRRQASYSDSESEPESASPEIRPLPDDQYHVIYKPLQVSFPADTDALSRVHWRGGERESNGSGSS